MNLEQQLTNIEQRAQNDWQLLEDVGAAYFPAVTLLRLWGEIHQKRILHQKLQSILMMSAASSPLWLLLAVGCSLLEIPVLATLCLSLFLVAWVLFFVGLLFLYQYFGSRGTLDVLQSEIEEELQRRPIELSKKRVSR